MKKLFIFLTTLLIFTNLTACKPVITKNSVSNNSVPFSEKTVFEITKEMMPGWNLGNTLDATSSYNLDSETSWGQPYTQKAMIDNLAASGIRTIRIPVSWHNHITDTTLYTIAPEWIARVKTIVDWAIDDGLYVIINLHHDNYLKTGPMPRANGYYPRTENLEESKRYITAVWKQIATVFNNDYDEHLIFETMNEPRLAGTNCEWNIDNCARCIDAAKCLKEMNQTALNTIRATGGNNAKRFVMCPALQASVNSANSASFKMPEDKEPGRLILSVHAYTPYSFAMESPGERTFTQSHKKTINEMFSNLKKQFLDKGYAVVIGEYGATNKDNLEDRVAWFDYYISTAKSFGVPCILWDNGVWQIGQDENGNPDYNEGYGFYNRTEQKWYFPGILEVIVK